MVLSGVTGAFGGIFYTAYFLLLGSAQIGSVTPQI